MKKLLAAVSILLSSSIFAEVPKVYFIEPADGATVTSPVHVKFGLSGFGVAPAGSLVKKTGHHHLIIDSQLPNLTQPIPANKNYEHFGKGQTEANIELKPGKHTLQLLLGDGFHRPHPAPLHSEKITVIVVDKKTSAK